MNIFANSPVWKRWLVGLTALILALVVIVIFFPWDLLRGPINRYVSEQLGRRFEITRHLSVDLGSTSTVRADGIEFANPEWAREPYLVKASAAEFDIRLWPLLFGKVELPRISLTEPEIGLQQEPDGRRTWALSRDTSDSGSSPKIGLLTVDKGTVKYLAPGQGADVFAQFSILSEAGNSMPLMYKASGKWKKEAFTASGRTGGVLQLGKDIEAPFPLEVAAVSGRTTLKAKGSVSNLAEFAGLDATFDIQGRNLEELYRLLGVALPNTPPYKLRGKLGKSGGVWSASQIQGVLGTSDLSGQLSFDTSGEKALLTGKVQSKVLDFVDLAPVIGLPVVSTSSVSSTASVSSNSSLTVAPIAKTRLQKNSNASGKVLPTAQLDLVRLKSMNADVTYSAADIRHVKQLPLDSGSVRIKLNNGVLQLDPVVLGVAGGKLAGRMTIDVNKQPASFDTRLDVRAVQLNKLFPTVQTTKTSFGKISGLIDLKGQGNSAAQMLGSSTGNVAVLMGKGELSNILLEFMGLDGGEVIKFLIRGDRNVELRCAAAAFDVKQGLMSSRTIVLDTSDTVISGSGQINLADETLNLLLKPEPKDRSILSLRSPLKIGGTFASPKAGPEAVALAERSGLVIALGLINPLLALAATIETGPGQDADCQSVLRSAEEPKQAATAGAAKAPKK